MGSSAKNKGDRVEREMVAKHISLGVHAQRIDARLGQFSATKSHDIDIYPNGKDEAPLCGEVKARKNGEGFVQLDTWLGDNDFLILKKNRTDPLVCVPWRVWSSLIGGGNE